MNSVLLISVIVLWVLVAGLALTVLALARQVGVLHERIAPAGALMVSGGPKVGARAPQLMVSDIDGNDVEVGGARESGMSELLFFLSPTCPVCKTLLPALKSARQSEKDWLSIVLASDGDAASQRAFIDEYELNDFPYVLSTDLGMTFEVGKLPFAALIDQDGILVSKGLVNSREHIESLFEAKESGFASVQKYIGAQDR